MKFFQRALLVASIMVTTSNAFALSCGFYFCSYNANEEACAEKIDNKIEVLNNQLYNAYEIRRNILDDGNTHGVYTGSGATIGCLTGIAAAPILLGGSAALCVAGISVGFVADHAISKQNAYAYSPKAKQRLLNVNAEIVKKELELKSIKLTKHMVYKLIKSLTSSGDQGEATREVQHIFALMDEAETTPLSVEEINRAAYQLRVGFKDCRGGIPTFEHLAKQVLRNRGMRI